MKKQKRSMIPIAIAPIFCIAMALVPVSCMEKSSIVPKEEKRALSSIISEAISTYNVNHDLDDVALLMRASYGIDFYSTYERIRPALMQGICVDAREAVIAMENIEELLALAGVVPGTAYYTYLADVNAIFNEVLSEHEVMTNFNLLGKSISKMELDETTREKLLSINALISSNYGGVYELFNDSEKSIAAGRTQGWFRKLWRAVRSVVLTAAVGAAIGVLSGTGQYGIIIGLQ